MVHVFGLYQHPMSHLHFLRFILPKKKKCLMLSKIIGFLKNLFGIPSLKTRIAHFLFLSYLTGMDCNNQLIETEWLEMNYRF